METIQPDSALPTVDLIVPFYNEEEALPAFHRRICAVIDPLPNLFHFIYVNDGSSDQTQALLNDLCQADPRITVLELSRNFGHQAALTAGLDHSQADIAITLDGDGEHPPEMIPEMLMLAEQGYDIVATQRSEDQQASGFKRRTSNAFYRFINWIGSTEIQPGVGDFRLMKKNVVDSLRSLEEYHRFLRGLVSWMGFRSVILPYVPAKRLAGKSKYTLPKMFKLAANATFSFSLVPLYLSISLGGVFLVLAIVEMIYVLSFWVRGAQASLAPGWSSLMFVLLVVGGTIMIGIGFIGIYVGYIFQEVKHRPVYLVRQKLGQDQPQEPQ